MERAAAPSLTLPVFGADVPGVLTLRSDVASSTSLAEQLLDVGVLEAGDWEDKLHGALKASIAAGLKRWVSQWPGGRENDELPRWRFFDLTFFAIDDLEGIGHPEYSPNDWANTFGGRKDEAVAVLGLSAQSYCQAVVRHTVRRMEKRVQGAGFSLLNLVQRALGFTVGVGGPAWTMDYLFEYGDHGYADDEEAEEADYPTYGAGERYLPEETHGKCEIDWTSLKIAASMRWRNGVKEALDAALKLRAIVECKEIGGHEGCLGWAQLPVRICWSSGDIIEGTFDLYHDSLDQGASSSDVSYMRGFQPGGPREISAEGAVEAIMRVVKVLDLCDVILWGLTDKVLAVTTDYQPYNDDGDDAGLEPLRERLRIRT